MPNRSTTRRPTTGQSRFTRSTGPSTNRFGRPGATPRTGAGRFGKPLSVQRPPARKKQQSGLTGLLSTAMTKLPAGGAQKGRRGKRSAASSGGGKAKPAMALLAAAGAVFGRRQMQKRKERDTTDLATPPAGAPPVTPA